MSFRNRELEVKLLVPNVPLEYVYNQLRNLFSDDITRMVHGSSEDTYWSLTGADTKADFIRMRRLDNGVTQITVKAEDRGDAIDRMEIDVDTETTPTRVYSLLRAAHGRATGSIRKTYHVLWIGGSEHTTISCYSITSHEFDSIIIEAETTSESEMLELEFKITEHFTDYGISIKRAPGSLFTMFIRDTVNAK